MKMKIFYKFKEKHKKIWKEKQINDGKNIWENIKKKHWPEKNDLKRKENGKKNLKHKLNGE